MNQKTDRSISFWMVWGNLGLILLAGCGALFTNVVGILFYKRPLLEFTRCKL